MYNMFVGILQAVGDSKHPLYYLILSSVINVVLDLLFIAGFGMGVEGAALATDISQVVSAVFCMIQLMRCKTEYRLVLHRIRFEWDILKQIVRFGLPSGFQNSIIAIANVVVQSNINSFGEMAMAGCGAYSKIEGFGFLPITSFTMALTTFVSQNLGARDYERTKKGARFGIICAVVLAELIGIIIFIAAPVFTAAFDRTPEVIVFGTERARTAALFYCLLAYSHSVCSCTSWGRKVGDTDDCHDDILVRHPCGSTYGNLFCVSFHCRCLLDISSDMDAKFYCLFYLLQKS